MDIKEIIKLAGKPLDRSKAIWKYCLDCAGGSSKEVTLCHLVDCPLWPWRFGCKMSSPVFMDRMKKQAELSPGDFREAFDPNGDPPDSHSSAPMSPQTHTESKPRERKPTYRGTKEIN